MTAASELVYGSGSGTTDAARGSSEREHAALVAEIANVRALLEGFRDGGQSPPPVVGDPIGESSLDRIARLFDMSPFERQLLMVAAAVELDGDLAALSASLQGGLDPRPSFALALAALQGGHWDALAPSSPLRWWRLLEVGHGLTVAGSPLRIDERVLHEIAGVAGVDQRLDGIARTSLPASRLAPSHLGVADEIATTLIHGSVGLVLLDGDDLDARRDVAEAIVAAVGCQSLLITARSLPIGQDLARLSRIIDRELKLLDAMPIIDVDDGSEATAAALIDLLVAPTVFMTGGSPGRSSRRVTIQRRVRLPTPAEQRGLWERRLHGPLDKAVLGSIEQIAQNFRLGAATIDAVAVEVAAARVEPAAMPAMLQRLSRDRARGQLDELAELIDPVASWDDLVLPAAHIDLLREIARHGRHRTTVYERWGFGKHATRGLGVTALFSGESGTGKTMAAEVLAADLGLDLFRIDLSATVSKYIGETEKNLRRLFDAAETSGAVLLFDEADALFGRRGEVRDGHDRYANLEVAYLLQRMEAYRGLAILTTNMRSHIDRAFLRRLRFVIQFPFPDHAQRTEIWRRIFPATLPLDGIDPIDLGRMAIAGGSISSIALSAAFAAAEDRTPVTAAHIVRAARVEYAKTDRSLTDSEMAGLR
jgi:hypothetical protein